MNFEILNTSGYARTGRLHTPHGDILTPAFMPVGTCGAVKTLSPSDLKNLGAQIILGNTYHLYLRPGLEVLRKFTGLHSFMQWPGPILTDSGGFQVFSLAKLKKIHSKGVVFQSHLNGDTIELTPEKSAEIQQVIGSDIAMVLDECIALPNRRDLIENAVLRSLEWAKQFFEVPRKEGQQIFGIVQGGTELDLRLMSLEETLKLPVDGLAIGGLSVGESHCDMVRVLDHLVPYLPPKIPHYLMGVGTPLDLLEAVRCGIDLFDCVLPTRNARNAGFFTDQGLINIRNEKYRLDERPIAQDCHCECCTHYSRAYLRHLFQIKEILACRLATIHNLHYYLSLMFRMRTAIESATFGTSYQNLLNSLAAAYPERVSQPTDQVGA